jgi:hypothetical protein
MMRARGLILGLSAAVLLTAGAVGANALMDLPQDATPAPDPIGDALRNAPTPPVTPAPEEPAPAGDPAPAAPVPITPAAPLVIAEVEAEDDEGEDEARPAAAIEKKAEAVIEPGRRQRRPVAVIQAIDKITAESMRFEVEVGGRPVRFKKSLIFSVRACEVSAPDELTDDAVAYLDISIQPRGTAQASEPRQIFRGWMFASSPAVSGLQHPIYDAWVVGCRA